MHGCDWSSDVCSSDLGRHRLEFILTFPSSVEPMRGRRRSSQQKDPARHLLCTPASPLWWPRLPCLRQRHAGRDRSRVRGERRFGGQLLRVHRHHRGEVEHGRSPPLGSHEGHRRGDDCAFRWFICFFVSSEDLRRPRKVSAGHEEDKGIRGRPFRLCTPSPAGGKYLF